jgi:hypothetical protein
MRERKLIEQMGERLALDRDAESAGVGEIREPLATWWMFLREEYLTLAAVGSAPLAYAALERPKRSRPVFTWAAPL